MTRILPKAKLTDVNRILARSGPVPWRIEFRKSQSVGKSTAPICVAIVDTAGNEIVPFVSPEIAGRIVAAVNMVECAHIKDRDNGR